MYLFTIFFFRGGIKKEKLELNYRLFVFFFHSCSFIQFITCVFFELRALRTLVHFSTASVPYVDITAQIRLEKTGG